MQRLPPMERVRKPRLRPLKHKPTLLAVLSKETDFLELPQPVRYEELQKECLMSLRPETFEGMRFDFTKPLNQR